MTLTHTGLKGLTGSYGPDTQASESHVFSTHPAQTLGLILAGGQGSRMGGVDKGLQPFRGKPLAQHVAERLSPQVNALIISANRNVEVYQQWVQRPEWVFGDKLDEKLSKTGNRLKDEPLHAHMAYRGPCAGILAAFERIELHFPAAHYLVVSPCDAPNLPLDYVHRLLRPWSDAQPNSRPKASFFEHAALDGKKQVCPIFCAFDLSHSNALAVLRHVFAHELTQKGRLISALEALDAQIVQLPSGGSSGLHGHSAWFDPFNTLASLNAVP